VGCADGGRLREWNIAQKAKTGTEYRFLEIGHLRHKVVYPGPVWGSKVALQISLDFFFQLGYL
jgi:hypothetical protein